MRTRRPHVRKWGDWGEGDECKGEDKRLIGWAMTHVRSKISTEGFESSEGGGGNQNRPAVAVQWTYVGNQRKALKLLSALDQHCPDIQRGQVSCIYSVAKDGASKTSVVTFYSTKSSTQRMEPGLAVVRFEKVWVAWTTLIHGRLAFLIVFSLAS